MRTIVTTALSLFTLIVLLQVQGIATEPDDGLEAAPTPLQPEQWDVWGQAELEGVIWRVQPIDCGSHDVDQTGVLCVEVSMHNPSFNVLTRSQRVRILANNNEPMARMPSIPMQVDARDVTLQAVGGTTARTVLVLAVPEGTGGQLELRVGGTDDDPWSGQTVASFLPWTASPDQISLVF